MNSESKEILVFKTNLETEEGIKAVSYLLDEHPQIIRWNVDRWDNDHVLRIETGQQLTAGNIIHLVKQAGFFCEELPDDLPLAREWKMENGEWRIGTD